MSQKIIIILSLLFLFITSCGSVTSENEDLSKDIAVELVAFKTAYADGICEIKVPDYFVEMNDVNESALIQSGYMEEPNESNIIIEDEIYAIVLVDYKNDIEKVLDKSRLVVSVNGSTKDNKSQDKIVSWK